MKLLFSGYLLLAGICPAQQAPAPDQPRPAAPTQQDLSGSGSRILGAVPGYGTVEDERQLPPLTSAEKLKLALHYFDPYTFAFVALQAGIGQAANSQPEYGQGGEGYGKRYGAYFADGLANNLFVTGIYPSLLHQDPRYYRRGHGGFMSRTGYAVGRIFVTRQDSGRTTFNFSEFLGDLTSAGISNAYYPDSERAFGDVGIRASTQLGFNAAFNVLKEFGPDLTRVFKKKKKD